MHQTTMLQIDIPEQREQLTADTAEMQILLAVLYQVTLWKRGLRNLKGNLQKKDRKMQD
ncbi:hypothetical protein RLOC_00009609 [Lonchura striata]|uniref:Uncharacterized protein n=1 Tax=Lonchura striata TaxID=40157 RepID=A0A218URH5_9PASE|nr:hypothetical protein RLOC_00009609 [Lonchura striata domestica]